MKDVVYIMINSVRARRRPAFLASYEALFPASGKSGSCTKKINSVTVSIVSPPVFHEMGLDAMIFIFLNVEF